MSTHCIYNFYYRKTNKMIFTQNLQYEENIIFSY